MDNLENTQSEENYESTSNYENNNDGNEESNVENQQEVAEENQEKSVNEVENEENQADNDNSETTYTQDEVDRILQHRLARVNRKNKREQSDYEELIYTLKNGMGLDENMSVKDVVQNLRNYYQDEGIEVGTYNRDTDNDTSRDDAILARADAQSIINAGLIEAQEVIKELEDNPERTYREDILLQELKGYASINEAKINLKKRGVDPEVLESEEFIDFARNIRADMPLEEVYDLYRKYEIVPKQKTYKPAGSVKEGVTQNAKKDFYTAEEADKFTKEDYLKDPDLLRIVNESAKSW